MKLMSSASHIKVKNVLNPIPMCQHGMVLRHRHNSSLDKRNNFEQSLLFSCFSCSLEPVLADFCYILNEKLPLNQFPNFQQFQSRWLYERLKYIICSETSIYRSQIIRFPRSVVQFLWSLSESCFNYGSLMYCFPRSIVSFSNPRRKR
jgi:hypothetical protein